MQVRTRHSFILLFGVLIGISLAIAHGVFAAREEAAQAKLPLSELRTFVEILNRVKSDYVEPVEDEKLLENSIRGMLDGLGPHSAYLSPDEFREVTISTSGKFGGLGIEVQMQNGFVRVVAPIDDTPAARAGIQAGDLVVRIDETAVKGLTLLDAVKLMRGDPGTKVTLMVLREGVEQPFKVDITRDIIKVKSVKSRLLEPGFGYLRITQFSLSGYGFDVLALYGFFSLVMFGATYFIVPRVTRREWLSRRLIKMHFLFSVYGVVFVALVALFGGLQQGIGQEDWQLPWLIAASRAFPYAVAMTFSWGLILFSNVFFFLHLALMWLRLGRRSSHPTLLVSSHGSSPHGEEGDIDNVGPAHAH